MTAAAEALPEITPPASAPAPPDLPNGALAPKPTKIFIATPVYGTPSTAQVSLEWHQKQFATLRDPAFVARAQFINADLVRSRSRAAHIFLNNPEWEWLLFWDADVIPRDIHILGPLTSLGVDVVGLPYPHKMIDFEAVADGVRDEREQATLGRQTGEELEALAQTVPYATSTPLQSMPDIMWRGSDGTGGGRFQLAEVDYMGFGFMLLSRRCVEAMTERYREELWYRDKMMGVRMDIVALFQLMIKPGTRELLSEDYAFCERWRAMGGKVYCATDPASHVGGHLFRGHQHQVVAEVIAP
jgi:hypothetical protein